jgi:hypothetical protein
MKMAGGLLPQMWLPRLREIEKPGGLNIKDWITSGAYSVGSLAFSSDKKLAIGFTIQIHDEHDFYAPIANEINRWASACFETVEAINKKPKMAHGIAWPLIQLYYSAFFGAHAICRAFGIVCSQLEQKQSTMVERNAKVTLASTAPVKTGFYSLTYDPSLKALTGSPLEDSHADLWGQFGGLVSRLSSDVLHTVAQSQTQMEASGLLSSMCAILKQGGASKANWLSRIRNQINYQKSHGAWYPYKKSNPKIGDIISKVQRWQHDQSDFSSPTGGEEIFQFVEAATFIIWLCRRVICELSSTRRSKRHFTDKGGLDFLRHARIVV